MTLCVHVVHACVHIITCVCVCVSEREERKVHSYNACILCDVCVVTE